MTPRSCSQPCHDRELRGTPPIRRGRSPASCSSQPQQSSSGHRDTQSRSADMHAAARDRELWPA